MMTPPKIKHNMIGDTIVRLLNDALELARPEVVAVQRSGIEITTDNYRPEPDFCVVDADYEFDQRYSNRIYLLGEVISGTDRIPVPGRPAKWIDVKRDIYRKHAACEAILLVEQDRFDVTMDVRNGEGWTTQHFTDPMACLALPMFGLTCQLRDLYKGTPLYRPARK